MGDVPLGYTPHYSIAKWSDGDNPGATSTPGLNNNWTIVDTAIYSASLVQAYTGTAPITVVGTAIGINTSAVNFSISGSLSLSIS